MKSLLVAMLDTDPSKRPTAREIIKHPWLSDVPAVLEILDEGEKDLIRVEFNIE